MASNYSSFSPNTLMDTEVFSGEVYRYVQGDTGPQIRLTLTDEDTGTATDLTSAEVKLFMKAEAGGPVVLDKTLYINPETAETGVAIVNWSTGDLDQTPGIYHGEIQITRGSGVRETLYEVLRFKIREEFA